MKSPFLADCVEESFFADENSKIAGSENLALDLDAMLIMGQLC